MANKDKELDDFWDLSSLIPAASQKKATSISSKSTKCEEVSFSSPSQKTSKDSSNESTVIKRYINPLHDENKRIKREAFSSIESYVPKGALLHSVTLKKRKSTYELYDGFVKDAIKYSNLQGKECTYVPFFSYVPQYDQLSVEQLSYYIWWRECFKNDEYIKTDVSYLLLFIYELINMGDACNPRDSQRLLAKLWNVYHSEFSGVSSKLAVWLCDFSLLHKLSPPTNLESNITKAIPSLKEFFIHIPSGDYEACVRSLLKYGTEYDYHSSKFATPKNIMLFDRHIFGAMLTAVKFFSKDGKILSELASEDSKLIRNAFDGALCASKWRYEIEVKYCSFSRSNELRFIMGDIVKYAENKIRAFLGIKSRLSVYSIRSELQHAIDEYFEIALANEAPPTKKKVERQEYDILYDAPVRPLSLENAKRIESESWSTTNDLVSAFEDEKNDEYSLYETPLTEEKADVDNMVANAEENSSLKVYLGKYLDFALAIKNHDSEKMSSCAKALGKLPDAIVDAINEISFDVIGDILIEDSGFGFEIIECYRDLI